LLPSISLAVSAIDKQLQALQPQLISNIIDVNETPMGLILKSLPSPALSVAGGKSLATSACWSPGDVIVGCNGSVVQSKADLLRAMRFSDSQIVTLDVVATGFVNHSAALAAGWLRKELARGRVVYENVTTQHVSWLHPELHLKPVVPLSVSLSSYKSGA
jgi:hypothetical protein